MASLEDTIISEELILLERAGGVATLTLNDPARLNPLSVALERKMLTLLAELKSDSSVRALVVTGAGRSFCVGADLGSFDFGQTGPDAKTPGTATAELLRSLANPIILALTEFPAPVLSVVNGPAVGAGVGIALAADVVLASASAYFYLPSIPNLGIVPDLGATWFLPRVVGHARAVGMTLLGQRVSGPEAAASGLIWACSSDADLAIEAKRIAEKLAALPAYAAREVRRIYEKSLRHTLPEQLNYESDRQHELMDGPAFAEGVAAFLEKRKPNFLAC